MRTTPLATLNETRKGLLITWDYKLNTLTQLFMLGSIFVGIGFVMGNGRFDQERLAPMLLGYLLWFYSITTISAMSLSLMEEAQAGTLEQIYMSPAPTWLVVLGQSLANLVTTTVQMILIAVALLLLLGIRIPMRWEGLPVLALTLIGLIGFGFIIAGATLVFKHVESLANLLQNILLFVNGTILPVDRLPGWLEAFAKTLPTTQGIVVLRNVVIGGESLSAAWADSSLVWLTFHSILYLVVGWSIFKWCERIAKRQGSLGHY